VLPVEQHLRHLLDSLAAARGQGRDEDDEELTRLHAAVERRLAGGEPEEHRGLVESLERAETRFEADHPSLARSIRQALQSLSSAGI
jgi:hypothetical protein